MKPIMVYGTDWTYKNPLAWLFGDITGYNQMKSTQASIQAQIDYNNYMKAQNEKALSDWRLYVGSQGRTIKYPGLSYPGQIYKFDTATSRAGYDYLNASSNYYGNLPYRTAGLYGIASRFSRWL